LTVGFVLVDHFTNAAAEATRAKDDDDDNNENYPTKNFSYSFQFIETLITCEGSVSDSAGKVDIGKVESSFELLVTFLNDHLKVGRSSVKLLRLFVVNSPTKHFRFIFLVTGRKTSCTLKIFCQQE
jgi:hypothetical protein